MVYEVYAGGIHGLQATVDIETNSKKYDVLISAKTRGLLGKMAPWSGTFETHGRVKNGKLLPRQHKSVGTWKREVETKDYSFDNKGRFTKITIDEHDKAPHTPAIEAEITQGATDALTAALLVFKNYNNTGGKCEGTSKVFDGKRSYDQVFAHQQAVQLKSSRYNIYEGAAAECTLEVVPLKGKWHSKPRGWASIQEQGRQRGALPTIWLASIEEGAPAVPVKIRVKTDYGTLFMHLAEYNDGGEVLIAKKRVKDE